MTYEQFCNSKQEKVYGYCGLIMEKHLCKQNLWYEGGGFLFMMTLSGYLLFYVDAFLKEAALWENMYLVTASDAIMNMFSFKSKCSHSCDDGCSV